MKFRAWISDCQLMRPVRMIEFNNEGIKTLYLYGLVPRVGFSSRSQTPGVNKVDVKRAVLEQWIEQIDISKQEIYVGDIIKLRGKLYTINTNPDRCRFVLREIGSTKDLNITTGEMLRSSIITNIHNPLGTIGIKTESPTPSDHREVLK